MNPPSAKKRKILEVIDSSHFICCHEEDPQKIYFLTKTELVDEEPENQNDKNSNPDDQNSAPILSKIQKDRLKLLLQMKDLGLLNLSDIQVLREEKEENQKKISKSFLLTEEPLSGFISLRKRLDQHFKRSPRIDKSSKGVLPLPPKLINKVLKGIISALTFMHSFFSNANNSFGISYNILSPLNIVIEKSTLNVKLRPFSIHFEKEQELMNSYSILDPYSIKTVISSSKITKQADSEKKRFAVVQYEENIQWYWPPEIICGILNVNSEEQKTNSFDFKKLNNRISLDAWSFGTLIAEMFLPKPLFYSQTISEQFEKFLLLLGFPRDLNLLQPSGNEYASMQRTFSKSNSSKNEKSNNDNLAVLSFKERVSKMKEQLLCDRNFQISNSIVEVISWNLEYYSLERPQLKFIEKLPIFSVPNLNTYSFDQDSNRNDNNLNASFFSDTTIGEEEEEEVCLQKKREEGIKNTNSNPKTIFLQNNNFIEPEITEMTESSASFLSSILPSVENSSSNTNSSLDGNLSFDFDENNRTKAHSKIFENFENLPNRGFDKDTKDFQKNSFDKIMEEEMNYLIQVLNNHDEDSGHKNFFNHFPKCENYQKNPISDLQNFPENFENEQKFSQNSSALTSFENSDSCSEISSKKSNIEEEKIKEEGKKINSQQAQEIIRKYKTELKKLKIINKKYHSLFQKQMPSDVMKNLFKSLISQKKEEKKQRQSRNAQEKQAVIQQEQQRTTAPTPEKSETKNDKISEGIEEEIEFRKKYPLLRVELKEQILKYENIDLNKIEIHWGSHSLSSAANSIEIKKSESFVPFSLNIDLQKFGQHAKEQKTKINTSIVKEVKGFDLKNLWSEPITIEWMRKGKRRFWCEIDIFLLSWKNLKKIEGWYHIYTEKTHDNEDNEKQKKKKKKKIVGQLRIVVTRKRNHKQKKEKKSDAKKEEEKKSFKEFEEEDVVLVTNSQDISKNNKVLNEEIPEDAIEDDAEKNFHLLAPYLQATSLSSSENSETEKEKEKETSNHQKNEVFLSMPSKKKEISVSASSDFEEEIQKLRKIRKNIVEWRKNHEKIDT